MKLTNQNGLSIFIRYLRYHRYSGKIFEVTFPSEETLSGTPRNVAEGILAKENIVYTEQDVAYTEVNPLKNLIGEINEKR